MTVYLQQSFLINKLRTRYAPVTGDILAPVPARLKHGFSSATVQAQLARVLASEAFRTSPRSQAFLQFVVDRTLEGDEESIKERNIAVEAFGRRGDYNTSEDSFVRVKASEVRRRLRTYYADASPEDVLRIELPIGGYVPQFVLMETATGAPAVETAPAIEVAPMPSIATPAITPPHPRSPRRFWPLALAGVIILVAAAAGMWSMRAEPRSALDDFWSPVLSSPQPLLIFLPIPSSFSPTSPEYAKISPDVWQAVNPTGEHRIFASTPHKVGLGAAVGAIRFAALCTQTRKPYILKAGEDFSFADLRNQPSVLFGAFSSPWTEEMNNEYRFKLVRGRGIQDSLNPSREWLAVPGLHPGSPLEDYALATRVFDSKSGRLVIIAAGVSTFGTQAAAEFLTEPSRLTELAARAPQRLHKANFQVLLHTKVIGNTPTPARIVDTHFW